MLFDCLVLLIERPFGFAKVGEFCNLVTLLRNESQGNAELEMLFDAGRFPVQVASCDYRMLEK